MSFPDSLIEALRASLGGMESPEEIAELIRAAGIPDPEISEIVAKIGGGGRPETPEKASPRLIVDWGSLPQVGHQARPRMLLVCPPYYHGRPNLQIRIDRELDHDFDPADLAAQLRHDGNGVWCLHVPFRLTTNDQDCRPGQYLIDVQVSLDAQGTTAKRFFHTQIRLTIPAPSATGQRELIIDGDGQSVVNLHGHSLADFSRVVLRGGDDGIINLQQLAGASSDSSRNLGAKSDATTHEYELHVDQNREQKSPRLFDPERFRRPVETSRGSLVVGSDKRILVIAQRYVTFGRNRDCDVVLRFIPRSEEHDRFSQNISRRHFSIALDRSWAIIRDLNSRTGIELDHKPIDVEACVGAQHCGSEFSIGVGIDLEVETPLRLGMTLYGSGSQPRSSGAFIASIQEYCRAAGEQPNALIDLAEKAGIDACRIRRRNNLAVEEEYLLLYSSLLLGNSARCPIRLQGARVEAVHARIMHFGDCFWLENLVDSDALLINGEPIPPHRIVPLVPGMVFFLGDVWLQWSEFQQLGL